MHSSRMRTGRALTDCISWCPGGMHGTHAPPLPCMPPFAMHTRLCHACPLHHTCPPFAIHAPLCQAYSPFATHTPSPCTLPLSYTRPPPVNKMTDRCKNITLATTSLQPVTMHVKMTTSYHFCHI